MTKIMRNTSSDFDELCEHLYEHIKFDPVKLAVIGCDGTLSKTRSILETHFPQYDVEATLKYFQEKGGYCDCEVLLNVDPTCECDCDEDGDCECTRGCCVNEN